MFRFGKRLEFCRCCAAALPIALGALQAFAQNNVPACGVPPIVAANTHPNVFSEEQEQWLGDAMADLVEGGVTPIRDQSQSAHLQEIADRLVKTLPPTKINFRVLMVESSAVNGFSLAGGRIYVTRKLVTAAANDDELAAVIGHEIGHIASHQFAFETTADLKRLLGVTQLGNRADVYAKFHALMDARTRENQPVRREDEGQDEADRIGVYAEAAAGYWPQASADFWNRVFFVGGKTGSRVSDFFGITKPNEKRLRGMRAMALALPPGCGAAHSEVTAEFTRWHDAVIANQAGEPVTRSAALSELTLSPPLRLELEQARFSPDGKSILAQDESSIFVLSREPFAVRYRIDANNALPANFSPDSQSITFSTPGMRTEQWSAQEKKLIAAHEMLSATDYFETRLSPDGRTLICVGADPLSHAPVLQMLDTTTTATLWEKRILLAPAMLWLLYQEKFFGSTQPILNAAYSSDNNVLLLGTRGEKVALDLRSRTPIKLGGKIEDITGQYAFIGPDSVAGIDYMDKKDSGVYSFPQGKLLNQVSMPFTSVKSVTNPGSHLHVLMTGLKDYDIGLADLASGNYLMALKTHALDEFDGMMIGEAAGGSLAMSKLGNADQKLNQYVQLPLSPLGALRAVAVSPDGKYLAMSSNYRGGLWELKTGKQIVNLYGFTDASWTKDDTLYIDVPKREGTERHIAQASMTAGTLKDLAYKVDDESHMRYGRLTDWIFDEKKHSWTLAMHDPADDQVTWSKSFVDAEFSYTSSVGSRDLLFSFGLDTKTAKAALAANKTLADEARGVANKRSAQLIEVINGETGADNGEVVAELPANYAGVDGLNRAGDLLYVDGVDDRTAVYSLSTGQKLRQIFGHVMAMDAVKGRVFLTNRVGEAVVFDATGAEVAHYQLGDPIRYAVFREDANLVTVLTADQKVRTLAATAAAR